MDLIDRNAVLKLPRNVTKNLSGEVIEETIDVDRIKKLQPFECTVDRWCTDCGEYDTKNHRCPRFNRVIRETVKEIQAERKKGQWIDMGDFEQCSVCGGTHLKEFQSYYGKTKWIKTNYCPNCGVIMDGESDEND